MTEVAIQQAAVPEQEPPVAAANGTAEEHQTGSADSKTTNGSPTNGDASGKKPKKEKATKKPKEPAAPAPKVEEDPVGWAKWHQKSKKTMSLLRYQLAKWTHSIAVDDESKQRALPKGGLMSEKEFTEFFRDGFLVASLANKLSPGTIEIVHEGEATKQKENHTENWDGFINFLKEKAGITQDKIASREEIIAGKSDQLFYILYELGLSAREKFNVNSFDVKKASEELLLGATNAENSIKNVISAGVQFVQKKLGHLHLPGKSPAPPVSNGEQNGSVAAFNGEISNGISGTNGTEAKVEEAEKPEQMAVAH